MNDLTVSFKGYAAGTLLALDLIGTFVFALGGAVAGVRQRLDIFGVLVLSLAAASAGGIMRDLLIGSVPPVAIRDWRYLAASLLAGLLVFDRERLATARRAPGTRRGMYMKPVGVI